MFGVKKEYRVQKFDIQNQTDVSVLEFIKQRALIDKAPGWTMCPKCKLPTIRDMFVLLE